MWRTVVVLVLVACGSSSSGGGDDGNNIPLTADEAATACAVYGSCLGDGVNDCYTDAMPYWTTSEARCAIAASGNCDAIRQCFGLSYVIDPACAGPRMITCEGPNLVSCSDGVRSTISCPDASRVLRVGGGPTCVPTATGALCGDATCSAESSSCNGSVASSCYLDKGVKLSLDCADYGQSCSNGVCTSAGGGGACTDGTLPRCDGSVIVSCSDGVESRRDCAAVADGASCYSGIETLCGFGSACYPTKGTETCAGTSLTFCAAGVVTTIDCTTLGFTNCFGGHCVNF